MAKIGLKEVSSLLSSLSSLPRGNENGKKLTLKGKELDLSQSLKEALAANRIEAPSGAVGLMLRPYLSKTLDALCEEEGSARIQAIIDKFV